MSDCPPRKTVAQEWREVLSADGAYQHHCPDLSTFKKTARFSRMWRRIFRNAGISSVGDSRKVFEIGFGGCKHLAAFSINGWEATGVESSDVVAAHAMEYISELSRFKTDIKIKFIHGDFLEMAVDPGDQYDLVFHVGVLEHYFDSFERLAFLKKMFALTKSGGHVVSIVPNGTHVLRPVVTQRRLGGYTVPEIDYSAELVESELIACGAQKVVVLPHNLCQYLLLSGYFEKNLLFRKACYYLIQCIPAELIPEAIARKHAEVLIGIGTKP